MPRHSLPERPDIGQLKRQAKELLRAAKARNPEALDRFRIVPPSAQAAARERAGVPLALHDAQSVIAREYGFPSWKALVERVEAVTMGLDDALHAFVRAATDGRSDRARRLLSLHPGLPQASFHAALVLGDAAQVETRLRHNPALATQTGGPCDWPPLLYACHTSLHAAGVADAEGLAAIARQLLALGADPKVRFPWLHHGVQRQALWGAMLVTRLPALAAVLLEAGANPNDGVTLPILASGGDTDALDILFAHGADPNQHWASDGSAALYAILQWGDAPAGVRWLLEHGADPDPVFSANGETPLHAVARRGDVATARMLVEQGADLSRRRADGRTPYALAVLGGNQAVADWLSQKGGADILQPVDRLIAACGRGDRATAKAMLAAQPALRGQIGPEHYAALHRAAEQGAADAVEALLACGLDPDHGDDEIGKTALHSAAMGGQVETVRVLLAHGASVAVRDREFAAQPLVWAADGLRSHRGMGVNHAAVARLLLEAGSPMDWKPPGKEPSAAIIDVIESWVREFRNRPE